MSGNSDTEMNDAPEDIAEQQRQWQADQQAQIIQLQQTGPSSAAPTYEEYRERVTAAVRSNAPFFGNPGEPSGPVVAGGAGGSGQSPYQQRVVFDMQAANPLNPMVTRGDEDGDVDMDGNGDDGASVGSGGSLDSNHAAKMIGLEPMRSTESLIEYRHRVNTVKNKLGIISKQGFGSYIELGLSAVDANTAKKAKDAMQYERLQQEADHARKLDPNSDLFDAEYAAQWKVDKENRQANNRKVKDKLFRDIRKWEDMVRPKIPNMPRIPTPDPDQDSGDELYDRSLERDPVAGIFETLSTSFVPTNNSSGIQGSGSGATPSGGYAGTVGSDFGMGNLSGGPSAGPRRGVGGGGGSGGRSGRGGKTPGGTPGGPPTGGLPRCVRCARLKKGCSLRSNNNPPCENCKKAGVDCVPGPPTKGRAPTRGRGSRPPPRPITPTPDYPGYRSNPFTPRAPNSPPDYPSNPFTSSSAAPSLSRQFPNRPQNRPPPRQSPSQSQPPEDGGYGDLYSENASPRASPPRGRGAPAPHRGRSASPDHLQGKYCMNCISHHRVCDRLVPCNQCVRRNEERFCDLGGFGERFGLNPVEQGFGSYGTGFGNQSRQPLNTHQQQYQATQDFKNTLRSMGQPRGSGAPGQTMTGAMGGPGRPTGFQSNAWFPPVTDQGIMSPGLDFGPNAAVNPSVLQLRPGEYQRDMFHAVQPRWPGSRARQVEAANRPQQEMQNAAATQGLNNQLDPPQVPDPIIGGAFDGLLEDQMDVDMDLSRMGFDLDLNIDPGLQAPAAPVAPPPPPPDFTVDRAVWRGINTPIHNSADPLAPFPDIPAGGGTGVGNGDNTCSEQTPLVDGTVMMCSKKPARRCEFALTQPGHPDHTHGQPWYVCRSCYLTADASVARRRNATRELTKLYTCPTCAKGLIDAGKDARPGTEPYKKYDCPCMFKMRDSWVCRAHLHKAYDYLATDATNTANFFDTEYGPGLGKCPKCYNDFPDKSGKVYACKSCRYFVQEI
jgi:hypothetical protein